jgi:hypothetical protein
MGLEPPDPPQNKEIRLDHKMEAAISGHNSPQVSDSSRTLQEVALLMKYSPLTANQACGLLALTFVPTSPARQRVHSPYQLRRNEERNDYKGD